MQDMQAFYEHITCSDTSDAPEVQNLVALAQLDLSELQAVEITFDWDSWRSAE